MLRSYPHGEDPGSVAGGDTDHLTPGLGKPVSFNAKGTPPGVDGIRAAYGFEGDQAENTALQVASQPDGADRLEVPDIDFLQLIREAEDQALLYVAQANRKAWSQSLRAFHNEHYVGSKYTRPEWRGRSRLFVPKTRGAVRKDNAAVTASLFNSIDSITCLPGNEADPRQKAAASIMQQLVNYRTNRANEHAAFPWFMISVGARQDALLTGICVSKQCWKHEFRKTGEERISEDDGTGLFVEKTRDVYEMTVDRPDMMLVPPENIVIDPGANWLNPAQTSSYFIIKWPMTIEEIKAKQYSPLNPWNQISEEALKNSVESGKWDMAAIRRARDGALWPAAAFFNIHDSSSN